MKQPFLTGESVYLRTIGEDDLTPAYRDWFNDEAVCEFNSHHRFPNYDENMRDYYDRVIRSRQNLILAICDKASESHIGNIALQNIDTLNQTAEFAILIGDKAFWGKGVGKEAARLILRHGFDQLNLHRIYCGTSAENIAMQNMAASLGFKEEGRSREELFKNGSFRDLIHYGMLHGELKA